MKQRKRHSPWSRRFQPVQVPGHSGPCQQLSVCDGARSELVCGTLTLFPLRYFAAVQALEPVLRISNIASDLGS
jgi:hypothetical protein